MLIKVHSESCCFRFIRNTFILGYVCFVSFITEWSGLSRRVCLAVCQEVWREGQGWDLINESCWVAESLCHGSPLCHQHTKRLYQFVAIITSMDKNERRKEITDRGLKKIRLLLHHLWIAAHGWSINYSLHTASKHLTPTSKLLNKTIQIIHVWISILESMYQKWIFANI